MKTVLIDSGLLDFPEVDIRIFAEEGMDTPSTQTAVLEVQGLLRILANELEDSSSRRQNLINVLRAGAVVKSRLPEETLDDSVGKELLQLKTSLKDAPEVKTTKKRKFL